MKILVSIFLAVIGLWLTYQSLNKEGEQYNYALDSRSFLVTWSDNQQYHLDCHQEDMNSLEDDSTQALQVSQVKKLVDKGLMSCVMDIDVGVPLGVGRALFEAAYVPAKYAIPYELAKQALESDKPMRCSDYIKPLILACPNLLKHHMKRVENN